MDKKNIFITGAASGIGRETALYFADRNWFVGITDINRQGLESLQLLIGKDNCHLEVFDVTDAKSTQTAMEAFARRTGSRLDLLFNNAGYLHFGMFEDVDLGTCHTTIDVNLKGIINCTYHALPLLKNTPCSGIINMSSTSALYGVPDLSIYSLTKRGVLAFTEALDLELKPHGIHVSDIMVPYVNTPLLDAGKEAFSVKNLGVKIEPITVAQTVWKAARTHKLHWKISPLTYVLVLIFNFLPFFKRPIIKKLLMPPG